MAKKKIVNNAKKSAMKSIKKTIVSMIAVAVVGLIIVQLKKFGIDVDGESKKEMIEFIVQILLGGGTISFASMFGLDYFKKRFENE